MVREIGKKKKTTTTLNYPFCGILTKHVYALQVLVDVSLMEADERHL